MPRPSKKAAEDKNKVPAPVIPVPQPMMQHHMMPHQGMPMQSHQQVRPQQHHQMPQQVPMPHQQPPMPQMGAPPVQQPQGQPGRVVDSESFLTVRDSAVGRLTTILELLRSFTADYIRQTNLLLGEPTAEGAHGDLLANFESAAAQLMGHSVGDLGAPVEEKKERKKRTHDPNAPKRPLTPYFLYMQHARSIIANDLGPEAPKGAVQGEGQRRWASMNPEEKSGWNHAYQYNLRLYNARVQSYKSGNVEAKNMSDEEALRYADNNNVPMPKLKEEHAEAAPDDQDAIAQQLQQKGGGRKRKTGDSAMDDASKMAGSNTASPDKKRRRSAMPK